MMHLDVGAMTVGAPMRRSRGSGPTLVGFFYGCLCVLVAGCVIHSSGSGRPVPNLAVGKSIEWVTDPEADSRGFVSVTLRGDGIFIVGADFPIGTYISPGGRQGSTCEWRRIAMNPGGARWVVESGNGRGPQTVIINSTDLGLETDFCEPWRRLDDRPR